jgi:secreted PhoX family phosphatase
MPGLGSSKIWGRIVAKHIQELIASRRAVLGGLVGLPLLNLAACATPGANGSSAQTAGFTSVPANTADTITVPPGYRWRTLVKWGDALFDGMPDHIELDAMTRTEQERRFGQNNDMLALFATDYAFPPPKDQRRMILCANNEYMSLELTFPSARALRDFTPAQLEAMYASVGVSVLDLQRDAAGWRMVKSAAGRGHNRRITPFTPVLFSGPAARHPWIVAASEVVNAAEPARGAEPAGAVRCGTLGNCAGGLTPWGTYLTAEENFDGFFFGSASVDDQFADPAYALDVMSFSYPNGPGSLREKAPRQFRIGDNPRGPALYGWVVEIDPHDPTSTPKKRTALGRKKNECATSALARDGRVVIYMGDDQRDEHVYKFVSRGRFDPANRAANMDLLDDGQLYCAQFAEDGAGRWIPIDLAAANAAAQAEESPVRFRDEADLLVRARDAARLLGATPMDRPEDIEAVCDAEWRGLGTVLIACTNNSDRGFAHPGNPRRDSERPNTAQSNFAGHIVRIDETSGDPAATTFTWDVFALAGDPNTEELTARTRAGTLAHVSTKVNGAATFSGDRFACPDNMFIDTTHRVWISTDGNDGVFGDCNDGVLCTPLNAEGPRPVKRFLNCPVGAEVCGPLMAPDERAFFCAIQHPGAADVSGADYSQRRWMDDRPRPASSFPDGGDAWPRSAVIVVTRDDGGRIGD